MGKYKLEIITGRDRDDDGELTKTSFEANNDVDAFVKVLAEFNTCCSGYYNGDYEDDELDEEELETKQKVLAAAESGEDQEECIEILSTLYNDTMDISDYYDDIIKIITPDGRIVFEDDIDVEAWFGNSDDDYYDEDEDEDFDESFDLKKLNEKLDKFLLKEVTDEWKVQKRDNFINNNIKPSKDYLDNINNKIKSYGNPSFTDRNYKTVKRLEQDRDREKQNLKYFNTKLKSFDRGQDIYNKENEVREYQKFSKIQNGFSQGTDRDYDNFFKFVKNNEWEFPFEKEDIELLVKPQAQKYDYTLYLFYLKLNKSYGLAGKDNKYGDGFMEFGQRTFKEVLNRINSWWNKGEEENPRAKFLFQYPDFKFLLSK